MAGWSRYLFYRKEVWKTTWTFRLSLLFVLVAAALLTRSLLADRIGKSFVCEEHAEPSDAILMENFNAEYLVFERAAALKKAGIAAKVLAPVTINPDLNHPDVSSKVIVGEYARFAHLTDVTTIPVHVVDPITLNVAKDVRDYLVREHIQSVVFVTTAFRSRRSVLVYEKLFTPVGIKFACVPVFGKHTPDNWSENWHGIQDVVEEEGKLLYYQLYVLRWM